MVHKMIKVPDGTLRILVQGLQRISFERRVQDDPYLVGEFSELPDVVERLEGGRGADPERPDAVRPHRRPRPVPARGAPARRRQRRRSERALAPRRLDPAPEDRGEAAAARGARRREAAARRCSAILSRELEVFELGTKIQSQVQSEIEKGQREYFLRQQLKAIQEELGEGDARAGGAAASCASGSSEPSSRRTRARRWTASSARLERLPSASAEYGVIRTYLDWILSLPWSKMTEDNLDLERARADPRRGPLRPREGQGPDHRVPRRREAEERRLRADPLLRRPARRREDLARAVDRADARP